MARCRGSASTRSASVETAPLGAGGEPGARAAVVLGHGYAHSPTGLPCGSARTANRPKLWAAPSASAPAPPSRSAPRREGASAAFRSRTRRRRHPDCSRRDRLSPKPGRFRSDARPRAMTRSEEQLRVRTESLPVGRVRLRKHIVTEYEQVTVPVQREEIRLEQEPIGGPVAEVDSVAGGAIGDQVPGQVGAGDEHEVALHAERPVVRTETVPVERSADGQADGARAPAGRRASPQRKDRTRHRHRHRPGRDKFPSDPSAATSARSTDRGRRHRLRRRSALRSRTTCSERRSGSAPGRQCS